MSPVQVHLAAVGRDPQHGRVFAEGAQRVGGSPLRYPASLVDVERARRARLLEQLVVDRFEHLGGAGEDRVDRADRDRAPEQLVQQLDQLALDKLEARLVAHGIVPPKAS
jgi:hypothetical protein